MLKYLPPFVLADGVIISELNEFTSLLVIGRAAAHHSGNYTCAASNSAATVYSSATLTVNGKSRIINSKPHFTLRKIITVSFQILVTIILR